MTKTRVELEHENAVLRKVVHNTFWMARRYARGRMTSAPSTVNDCLQELEAINMPIAPDRTLVADGNSNDEVLDLK